ncbi:MAG TPA: HIT family protein [Candidatus Eisenbacteria bacterium]|nr:HIT family protein [Candidatus Eisenbacteria bacterium]
MARAGKPGKPIKTRGAARAKLRPNQPKPRPARTKAAKSSDAAAFCIFCEIAAGRIPSYKVWENRDFIAFLDIKPIRPGHVLLVPRKHHESVFDLPDALYAGVFRTARALAAKMERVFDVPRVGIVVEGFGVAHAHVHLVPISEAGQLNPTLAEEAPPLALQEIRAGLERDLGSK